MNPWQVLKQAVQELKDRNWTGSSTKVFQSDSVRVAGGDEFEAFAEGLITPAAILKPGAAQSDPLHGEEPDLVSFQFSVFLVCQIPGDRVGENAIMGAARVGLTDSRGKGLLEIEEEMLNALFRLNDLEGIRLQLVETGASQITPDPNNKTVAAREYLFEAVCTKNRFYHAPTQVQASNAGGTVTITWQDPPTRFDSIEIEVHRASGATAPATPSAATKQAGVALGTETYAQAPGAGQWSYAVFMGYDDYGGAASTRYSAQDTGTTATLTV